MIKMYTHVAKKSITIAVLLFPRMMRSTVMHVFFSSVKPSDVQAGFPGRRASSASADRL